MALSKQRAETGEQSAKRAGAKRVAARRLRYLAALLSFGLFALAIYASYWTYGRITIYLENWYAPAALTAVACLLGCLATKRWAIRGALLAAVLVGVSFVAIFSKKKMDLQALERMDALMRREERRQLFQVCLGSGFQGAAGWEPQQAGQLGMMYDFEAGQEAFDAAILEPPWGRGPSEKVAVVACVERRYEVLGRCEAKVQSKRTQAKYNRVMRQIEWEETAGPAHTEYYSRRKVHTYASLREARSGKVLAERSWVGGEPGPCQGVSLNHVNGSKATTEEIAQAFEPWLSGEAGER